MPRSRDSDGCRARYTCGADEIPGVPYKLDKTPASVRTPPPLHGQHTDDVLSGAGFSAAEIAELRQLDAI